MKKLLLLASVLFVSNLSAKSFVDEVADAINIEPEVSLNLGTGMLNMAMSFADDHDEDAKQFKKLIAGLNKIQVSVFELNKSTDTQRLSNMIHDKVDDLSSNGYEKIVSVKGKDEIVYIMAKVENQFLHDVMLVVMEENDELVIISLDGTMDLKQVMALSDHFDVDINDVVHL
jgi:hypothetical protein